MGHPTSGAQPSSDRQPKTTVIAKLRSSVSSSTLKVRHKSGMTFTNNKRSTQKIASTSTINTTLPGHLLLQLRHMNLKGIARLIETINKFD